MYNVLFHMQTPEDSAKTKQPVEVIILISVFYLFHKYPIIEHFLKALTFIRNGTIIFNVSRHTLVSFLRYCICDLLVQLCLVFGHF